MSYVQPLPPRSPESGQRGSIPGVACSVNRQILPVLNTWAQLGAGKYLLISGPVSALIRGQTRLYHLSGPPGSHVFEPLYCVSGTRSDGRCPWY